MDENPLQNCIVTNKKSQNKYIVNARGRPKTEKAILFSEQPQSFVSQMLSRIQSGSQNIGKKSNLEELLRDTLVECENNKLFRMSEEAQETHTKAQNCTKSSKSYSCDFSGCNYACKLFSNLVKHKRVHTNEKPYLCDRCSFRSNFINSLKVHKRIHTSERPYRCQYCNYKCNSSSNLKKHCLHRHPGA